MIKFFRKIRQRLLTENLLTGQAGKFSKYLLYAIGEIILVVIGILIALQINTWNENRKLDNQEVLYLKRLHLEIKQDVNTFTKRIEELEKGNLTIVNLSEAFNTGNGSDSLLIRCAFDYLELGCHYPFFNPSTSTFEDLSSTGNLGVIKDTDLRDQIVGHYANYKYIEASFQVNTNWALPIDAPFYIDSDFLKFEPTAAFLFPKTSTENLAKELRQDQVKYIRNAAVHYWINNDCKALLTQTKKDADALATRLALEMHK